MEPALELTCPGQGEISEFTHLPPQRCCAAQACRTHRSLTQTHTSVTDDWPVYIVTLPGFSFIWEFQELGKPALGKRGIRGFESDLL